MWSVRTALGLECYGSERLGNTWGATRRLASSNAQAPSLGLSESPWPRDLIRIAGVLSSNPYFQISQDPSPSHLYLFLSLVQEHQQQLPEGPLPWASPAHAGVQGVESSVLSLVV